jgi:hypothetical protein
VTNYAVGAAARCNCRVHVAGCLNCGLKEGRCVIHIGVVQDWMGRTAAALQPQQPSPNVVAGAPQVASNAGGGGNGVSDQVCLCLCLHCWFGITLGLATDLQCRVALLLTAHACAQGSYVRVRCAQVQLAQWKLRGAHPADITLLELAQTRHLQPTCPYAQQLRVIVSGTPAPGQQQQQGRYRACAPCSPTMLHPNVRRCQSAEVQARCLVDQATDANVLARSWVGWQPFL